MPVAAKDKLTDKDMEHIAKVAEKYGIAVSGSTMEHAPLCQLVVILACMQACLGALSNM